MSKSGALHCPEEFWRHRKIEADRQFLSGEITRPVYTATLFGLGYRGQELRSEANLIEMDKGFKGVKE